jgi:hypothetical protein
MAAPHSCERRRVQGRSWLIVFARRSAGIGASRPLFGVPAKVPSSNQERPFSLRGGNGSSCPKAAVRGSGGRPLLEAIIALARVVSLSAEPGWASAVRRSVAACLRLHRPGNSLDFRAALAFPADLPSPNSVRRTRSIDKHHSVPSMSTVSCCRQSRSLSRTCRPLLARLAYGLGLQRRSAF